MMPDLERGMTNEEMLYFLAPPPPTHTHTHTQYDNLVIKFVDYDSEIDADNSDGNSTYT